MDSLTRGPFIAARASEALEKTKQVSPPTDLDVIAAHYGITVRRGMTQGTSVAHFDSARNEIVLGEYDRWPLAHELGHFLLRHGSRMCYEGSMASDAPLSEVEVGVPFEAEANRFARHVLMPKPWIEFLLSRGWKPADMARRFQVSDKAFWYAFIGYGLL
jgi:IrrE N-terminal-like domain